MQPLRRSTLVLAALLTAIITAPPLAAKDKGITLVPLGVYQTFLFDEGAVEISAYEPATKRAFVTFAEQPRVEAIDLSDPNNPTLAFSINIMPWGGADAHATSVSVFGGVLAIAVPQGEEDTAPGKVLFFTTNGVFLSEVAVGVLPDMLTFSPNGRLVLTANEGQPMSDYSLDPEGSVSIIDMSAGAASLTNAHVTTVGFSAFNNVPIDPRIRIFGPGSSVAQDLEPEYLAVSNDSRTAWVTLQENNALAVIDLVQKKATKLLALGYKDHTRPKNGLDGGRDDGGIHIRRWPVLGMFLPDAIAVFQDNNKHTYLVTANEGDVREYDELEEAVDIEDIDLDPDAFPDAEIIQSRAVGIGRLKVTNTQGDSDGDGDYDRLFSFGARSFSVWTTGGKLVFDSGHDLEQITAAAYPLNFNASSTNNTRDDRSDDKGPEPEGVTVHSLFGRNYLFVMLERIGGIMVYDLSQPASPKFVQYINTRNFASPFNATTAGDLGPEAARVVEASASSNGKPLLIVSNEVSGSLRVFEIQEESKK